MGPLAAIVLALAAAHVQVADGSTQQCYVCEPRGVDTLATAFKDQPPVLKCEDFKKDDPRFVKNCPASSQGCLTQSVVAGGHHVTRTCADVRFNDCPVANGVRYCYCVGAVCNGQSHDPPPDDEPEDSVEGSASGEEAAKRHTVPTTPTAATTHAPHSRQATSAAARTSQYVVALTLTIALALALALPRNTD